VPRKVTFLAKSEYFTSPGIKGFIKKLTFIALGQVPIDRSGGKRSEAALATGLKVLQQGHCLGIYPEGTRSPDGRLYKGRTGIARMAIDSGAPIIPVAMFNTASFISFISLLKIRIERPSERAESGRRFAPNRTRTTIKRITTSLGPKFIVPTPWLMINQRLHQSPEGEKRELRPFVTIKHQLGPFRQFRTNLYR